MHFGLVMTTCVVFALLAGCTSPASPNAMSGGYESVVYRLAVTQDSYTDEFRVLLGAPFVADTAYPNGDRASALIRPLHIERITVTDMGPGLTFATQYAACNGEPGFCVTAVAIDPLTGMPIRQFHTPIEVFTRSPLEDGSADSVFLSERADRDFWPLSPVFIGDIWRQTDSNLDELYGRPFEITATEAGDAIDIAYRTSTKWHDLSTGDNVSMNLNAVASFGDGADPTDATLTYTEKAPGHSAAVEYRYVREGASEARVSWPPQSPNPLAIEETTRCGNGVQGRLFAESRLAYADAFAAVQAEPAYQAAQADADTMLVAARLPAPEAGAALEPPTRIWEFDVQMKDSLTTYRVQERYALPAAIPQEPEFSLVDATTSPADITIAALRDSQCAPWSAMESAIVRYIHEIGADGYRQALIERLPADLAFRYTEGQLVPEAEAYVVTIQPFVDDGNGGISTGPRIAFSLITGALTRIT